MDNAVEIYEGRVNNLVQWIGLGAEPGKQNDYHQVMNVVVPFGMHSTWRNEKLPST